MRKQDDLTKYVDTWRKRLEQEEDQQQVRAAHLREVARVYARRPVQDFGTKKVYLFGSLLQDNLVHQGSDIDLAVEGLKGLQYFGALSEIWTLLPPGAHLDLVRLERARPSLLEQIRAEAELLDAA